MTLKERKELLLGMLKKAYGDKDIKENDMKAIYDFSKFKFINATLRRTMYSLIVTLYYNEYGLNIISVDNSDDYFWSIYKGNECIGSEIDKKSEFVDKWKSIIEPSYL